MDFDPPKVAVVIDNRRYTRELIQASGRDGDKIVRLRIATRPASHVGEPLIEVCVGCLEGKVIPGAHPQPLYDVFLGEGAALADHRVFNNSRWIFAGEPDQAIHYIAGGSASSPAKISWLSRLEARCR